MEIPIQFKIAKASEKHTRYKSRDVEWSFLEKLPRYQSGRRNITQIDDASDTKSRCFCVIRIPLNSLSPMRLAMAWRGTISDLGFLHCKVAKGLKALCLVFRCALCVFAVSQSAFRMSISAPSLNRALSAGYNVRNSP